MKDSESLLFEEDIPDCVQKDGEFLADLDQFEADRIRLEAIEEAVAAQQRAEIGDLFNGDAHVWEYTPIRLQKRKETILSAAQLAASPPPRPSVEASSNPYSYELPLECVAALEMLTKDLANTDHIACDESTPRKRTYVVDPKGSRHRNCLSDVDYFTMAKLVLHSALEEIPSIRTATKAYYSLWLWFRLADPLNPFSFERCCEIADLDAHKVRKELEGWRMRTHSPAEWERTERQLLTLAIAEGEATARSLAEWHAVAELRDQLLELGAAGV